jgi:hypothetical protein
VGSVAQADRARREARGAILGYQPAAKAPIVARPRAKEAASVAGLFIHRI